MRLTRNVMEPGRYCFRQYRMGRAEAFSDRRLTEVRKDLLPGFMNEAGIDDVTKEGLRFIIDVPGASADAEIAFESGRDMPGPNIQIWRSPKNYSWNPEIANPLFRESLESFSASLGSLPTRGNKLYYCGSSKEWFGVFNSDPHAFLHVLVMPRDKYVHILDDGLSDKAFAAGFRFAFDLASSFGSVSGKTRLFANIGAGFQGVPRLHIHSQSFRGKMNELLPEAHGFITMDGGLVGIPEGQEGDERRKMLSLLELRNSVQGFSSEAKTRRAEIDSQLIALFNML